MMLKDLPQLEIRSYDQAGTQLDKVRTAIADDEPDFEDAALTALVEAARRYYARHPALAAIEVEIVTQADTGPLPVKVQALG
jgi:hypothetical protein